MSEQLALFNLNSVESVRPVHDPYSKVESTGNPVHDPYWDSLEKEQSVAHSAGLSQSQFSLETGSVVDSLISAPPDSRVGEQIFCPGAAESPYSSVGEQVSTNTKKTAHQHDTQTTHWVEKYWVARGNNKYWDPQENRERP